MKKLIAKFVTLALLTSCVLPTGAPAADRRQDSNRPGPAKPLQRPPPAPRSGVEYFDGPSFEISWSSYNHTLFDVNDDGEFDYIFSSGGLVCTASIPPHCSEGFLITAFGANELLVMSDQALVQPRGALIGNNAPRGAAWVHPDNSMGGTVLTVNQSSPTNLWTGSLGTLGAGYMGVRFTASDGMHYGWIRIRLPRTRPQAGFLQDTNPIGVVLATNTDSIMVATNLDIGLHDISHQEFTPVVVDWAYERRPNTPIRAGAGAPEIECEEFPDFRHEDREHHGQSGIVGRVMLEQMGARLDWRVRVSTEDHKLVTELEINESGFFKVNLKPGSYILTPFIGGLVGPSLAVTVQKNGFASVELPLVLGPQFPWVPTPIGDDVWAIPF
jgi:hypothetical protein